MFDPNPKISPEPLGQHEKHNTAQRSNEVTHDVESADSTEENSSEKSEVRQREIHGIRWFFACTSLYITCFLYGLDTTIAAAVQGDVVKTLGHIEQLAWIGAGFPLGSVTSIFLMGYLYNAFDMKRMFIITVLLFDIGSAICGVAPTMSALIVGRVIAGAGGTGIYLGSLNFVTALTVPKERGLYTTLIGFFWGIGAVLGPVVGGAFAVSSATWRWAFYFNLVVGAVSAPAYIFCLPSVIPMPGVSIRERLAGIDIVGFILGAGVWVSFLLGLTMAGGQWPWNDGRTIATFVVFGVVLVLYSIQQYFALFTTPARRAFPIHLLRERTQVLLYIATSAFITALFVSIFYIPLYFEFGKNDSSLVSATRLLPFVIVAATTSIVSGHFVGRIKVYMLLFLASAIILIVGGSLLIVHIDPEAQTSVIYGLTVVVAFGCGLSMQKGYSIAALTTDPASAGSALSLQNVAEVGGEVIALGISGQIYHSVGAKNLLDALSGHGFSETDILSGLAGAQSSFFSQLDKDMHDVAVLAITKALQLTFVLVPVAGGVMLIAALCMKWEKLY
ncbi:MFS general substrate transporter [Xylariaceae sp. FL1651]|nr:MFS general substrate transporter [Xylariaceae sp. FL1651]